MISILFWIYHAMNVHSTIKSKNIEINAELPAILHHIPATVFRVGPVWYIFYTSFFWLTPQGNAYELFCITWTFYCLSMYKYTDDLWRRHVFRGWLMTSSIHWSIRLQQKVQLIKNIILIHVSNLHSMSTWYLFFLNDP